MFKLLWRSVFIIAIKLAILSVVCDGFNQNQENPACGMNFYNEKPHTSVPRRPEVLTFDPENFICEGAEPVECNYSCPYQKNDGSCNNPDAPTLGMANTCFLRLLPACYEGKGDFRKSVTGGPLPQVRDITQNILTDRHQPCKDVTYLFTMHGQFIAHDMSKASQPQTDCCDDKNADDPECIPISVRPDDSFFSKFGKTCLSTTRSKECTFCKSDEHRLQQNFVSSNLDLNIVYGTEKELAEKLRTKDGKGKLKSSSKKTGYLLPAGKDKNDHFCPKGQDRTCFLAGDERVNQHVSLTSLHTIFAREHNRLAKAMKKLNPHWPEEKLFQECRKINIATHQCIIYKEYLPVLVGSAMVESFDLSVKQGPNGKAYNPSIMLGTTQEFTTAGFRVHSMVPTNIRLSNMAFQDTYSNPKFIRKGGIYNITSGAYQVPSEQYDAWYVTDLTNYLQKEPGKPYGSDLASIDIQRGRDHGLQPYVELVKFCSGGTITISSFKDLHKFSLMSEENIMSLQSMYDDVRDVDMKVGMLLENHYPGSQLGPAATCIDVIQFYSTQKGDRFYFDNDRPEALFTPDQRRAIKQCSMARLICDNTNNKHITRNPFIRPSSKNPDVSCDDIPQINLVPWKD